MLNDHRRKLLYRAWRRGFLEMDLIMGQFADAHLEFLTDDEVAAFERLLSEQDQEVYGWLIGRVLPPAPHDTPILARIKAFQMTMTQSKGSETSTDGRG